ncbi:hypothetical protein chiPu_0024591, partial [Chiloscyllium punctatum]|nr:hypothetical protein [Chiloscyllium punctatum]
MGLPAVWTIPFINTVQVGVGPGDWPVRARTLGACELPL